MFHLKKHYFDGIDINGNAIIIYFAELKLLGFKIPYSSFILSENELIKEKSVLFSSEIDQNNSSISISNSKLQISGSWNSYETSFSEILWTEKNAIINWNCIAPKAEFEIEWNGKKMSGLGYSEILHINFVPWKLPISTLKWGRFLSENHCIIWIEWIGKQPLKKVFWNGEKIENAEISDMGIKFSSKNAELVFENSVYLKNEKLMKIADKYPFLKLFFKQTFLQSKEMKFKNLSTLNIEGKQENGFSLYEIVLWEI